MFNNGPNGPHIFSRPWFAMLALIFGASTMAFGAYTAQNMPPRVSEIVRAPQEPAPAYAMPKVELSPALEQPKERTVSLREVRISGRAIHRHAQKPLHASACVPGWRSLAMGPETRQVREFCPTDSAEAPKH
jgi:hypothetical protein